MNFEEKIAALEAFYERSFGQPRFIAEVFTSGSYAKKVRALARLGQRSVEEVNEVCLQVDRLRRAFKIMDDLIDEDTVRDGEPAFWTVHGADKTVEQAARELWQAREVVSWHGNVRLFEQRLREIVEGARLEVEHENPAFTLVEPKLAWFRAVQKESSFRLYVSEALLCTPHVCEAARLDGIAAQMLDDGLAALHGKDGRLENSDERLKRLTYMRAFGVSAADAVAEGRRIKTSIAPILEQKGGDHGA